MITNLYVDGFNLYYRALKDSPFQVAGPAETGRGSLSQ